MKNNKAILAVIAMVLAVLNVGNVFRAAALTRQRDQAIAAVHQAVEDGSYAVQCAREGQARYMNLLYYASTNCPNLPWQYYIATNWYSK